jgi:hypothetical protein
VSEARRTTDEAVSVLDAEERAWLDEQLLQYKELLEYLRDH